MRQEVVHSGPAAAEPLPTDEKYLYVHLDVVQVLTGRDTVTLVYTCNARAVQAIATGVRCGALTQESLFLPGPGTTLPRTETVSTASTVVSMTGTAVFTDGTVWSVYCVTDAVLETTKRVACDKWQ